MTKKTNSSPRETSGGTPAARRAQHAELLRARIGELMAREGLSPAAFARRAAIERSTLHQILRDDGAPRLASADTLCRLADTFQVSVDWLLGRNSHPDAGFEFLDRRTTIADGKTPRESPLLLWHLEARGQKIRVAPANLPDMLKTDAVVRHEYAVDKDARAQGISAAKARNTIQYRLDSQRLPETETECCSTRESLEDFAAARGLWHGLSADDRREQLYRFARLHDEFYPSFRWFLFAQKDQYMSPATVFGTARVVLYIGNSYLSLTDPVQLRHFIQRFDAGIKRADVQPVDLGAFLTRLAKRVRD